MNENYAFEKPCKRCAKSFSYNLLDENGGVCDKCYSESISKGRAGYLAIQKNNDWTTNNIEKKKVIGGSLTVILIGITLLGLFLIFQGKNENPEVRGDQVTLEKSPKNYENNNDTQEVHWIVPIKRSCDLYKKAGNEIKKSEIYNANQEYIKTVYFRDLEMWIYGLSTTKGGGLLELHLKSKYNDIQLIQRKIEKSSVIYAKATDFIPLECIKVSGNIIGSASIFEESSVCFNHFQVRLSDLKKCN